jgi:hypothetical protein
MSKNKPKFKKRFKKALIVFLLFIIFYELIVRVGYDSYVDIKWGMAYSKPFATELKLDWKEVYIQMIDDMGVKIVRLPFYWNDIEAIRGIYDFKDYDWMMDYAKKNKVEIVAVVGKRLPRWPECHEPVWYDSLGQEEKKQATLKWVEKVVERYKGYENITKWQVENEPFLNLFGECEKPDKELIGQEVALVRTLDHRPILITDSGELSTWYKSSRQGDYLGTTVYRVVHSPILGYWSYWFIPSSFYRFKARLNFQSWDKMIISELQTEPWFPNENSVFGNSLEEQHKSMDVVRFEDHIKYAKSMGFSEAYLWGVEWWWWLKKEKGVNDMWNAGKNLFK